MSVPGYLEGVRGGHQARPAMHSDSGNKRRAPSGGDSSTRIRTGTRDD
ncbi:hypothetical protein ACH3VS_18355 [Streptomyces sp. WSLK1-3]